MIFNYKRVSTTDQNTERQLLDVPCDRAYIEKISGKNTNRPELQAMLLNIRTGDIINVHSMDRLARNTKDLLNLVEEITSKGAKIVFHKENLTFAPDRQDPYQKMMMTMLGAVSISPILVMSQVGKVFFSAFRYRLCPTSSVIVLPFDVTAQM